MRVKERERESKQASEKERDSANNKKREGERRRYNQKDRECKNLTFCSLSSSLSNIILCPSMTCLKKPTHTQIHTHREIKVIISHCIRKYDIIRSKKKATTRNYHRYHYS